MPPEDSPGPELRRMALTTSPQMFGFVSDSAYPTVYGVLTDWNTGGVTATIVSMRDGTASLYTTSTFGIIGGHGHESVRRAVERYVKTAECYVASATPVAEYPYPESGQVFFYILTYSGVRRVAAEIEAVENGADPARPLFAAAQDVLTELRLISEKPGR